VCLETVQAEDPEKEKLGGHSPSKSIQDLLSLQGLQEDCGCKLGSKVNGNRKQNKKEMRDIYLLFFRRRRRQISKFEYKTY
jgi:hypothetical protein